MKGETFVCHQCGNTIVNKSDFSTGYGLDKADNNICFACCGLNDAKAMENLKPGEKFLLYWSGNKLTNWPGTFIIPLGYSKSSWHNITGKRYDTWVHFKGNRYHVVKYGDNTEIAHIRRLEK